MFSEKHEYLSDILINIFYFLDLSDYKKVALVCKLWNKAYQRSESMFSNQYVQFFALPLKKINYPSEKKPETTWRDTYLEHSGKPFVKKILKDNAPEQVQKIVSHKNQLISLHADGEINFFTIKEQEYSCVKFRQKKSYQDNIFIDLDFNPQYQQNFLTCTTKGVIQFGTCENENIVINLRELRTPAVIYSGTLLPNGFLCGTQIGGIIKTENSQSRFLQNEGVLKTILANQLLAIGSTKCRIVLCDINNDHLQHKATFLGHQDSVVLLKWFNNDHLLSGSFDGDIKNWDLQTNCCVQTLQKKEIEDNKKEVSSLGYLDNNIVVGASYKYINLWDIRNSDTDNPVVTLRDVPGYIESTLVSRWNLFSANAEARAKIWDLRKNSCYLQLEEGDHSSTCLEMNEDKTELYVGWHNGAVHAYKI